MSESTGSVLPSPLKVPAGLVPEGSLAALTDFALHTLSVSTILSAQGQGQDPGVLSSLPGAQPGAGMRVGLTR